MPDVQNTIFVYDDFSFSEPVLLGILYVDVIKGSAVYSFEYNKDWLARTGCALNLDPKLSLVTAKQYASDNHIFGFLADASPDHWGRQLINKSEHIHAEKEARKPRKFYDSDYLLDVCDEARMGGLRFKSDPNGSFLSEDKDVSAPPWTALRTLEYASRNLENEDAGLGEKWLNQLIRPGSSLGGTRPKATVSDANGNLWIAKFPSRYDDNDVGAWEQVAHHLARLCGLNVPESKLERFSDLGSTFLVKRFDRNQSKRIHFASAMTLLGKTDGASAADGTSYLDIAAFIKAHGIYPKRDLKELWKRIVFSMAISNTDDHLRNHAFICTKGGWTLSPIFDINPVPYGDELSLNVTDADNRIDLSLALDAAPYFGIALSEAERIAAGIIQTVGSNWSGLAAGYGLSRTQIEAMRPAFSKIGEVYIAFPATDRWAPLRQVIGTFPKGFMTDREQPSWNDETVREEL